MDFFHAWFSFLISRQKESWERAACLYIALVIFSPVSEYNASWRSFLTPFPTGTHPVQNARTKRLAGREADADQAAQRLRRAENQIVFEPTL